MRYRERLQKDPVRCVAAKQIDRERKALFRKSQKDKEMALSKREQEKLADERRMMERTRKREYRLKLAQTKGREMQKMNFQRHRPKCTVLNKQQEKLCSVYESSYHSVHESEGL